MTFEELKQAYDHKDIATLRNEARDYAEMEKYSRKSFILLLYYLQRTGRWRMDKEFKRDTFQQYIFDLYALNESTFQRERWAYLSYPAEAEKFGAGVILAAKSKCGNAGVPKVLEDLKAINGPVTRPKIDKAINKHKKPAPKKELPTKRELEAEQDHVRIKLVNEQRMRIESEDQVTKLKATLADRNSQIARLSEERDRLRQVCEDLKAELLRVQKTVKTTLAPMLQDIMTDVHVMM